MSDFLESRRFPTQEINESREIAESDNCGDSCPFCGSRRLTDRLCKVWCDACGNLVRTCADL